MYVTLSNRLHWKVTSAMTPTVYRKTVITLHSSQSEYMEYTSANNVPHSEPMNEEKTRTLIYYNVWQKFSNFCGEKIFYVFFFFLPYLQVVSGPGIYGWFEPIPQFTQWLKEMKTVFLEQDANVKCCFVQPAFVSFLA